MRQELLDMMRAEREFLEITQKLIIEKIDMEFCDAIVEKRQQGMAPQEALGHTVQEYGYHFKAG